jgi:hypothetical protein
MYDAYDYTAAAGLMLKDEYSSDYSAKQHAVCSYNSKK